MKIGGRTFDFAGEPAVMGILNVTPDSFSDGSAFLSLEDAVYQAEKLISEGCDILDVGGESSRPGAQPVEAQAEAERVVPVIRAIRKQSAIPISIDTVKASVAEASLDAGASMINDISGLRADPGMIKLAARRQCPVCIMHMQGTPQNMQDNPSYENVIREIMNFFTQRILSAKEAGISKDNIILDPGIGFGKRLEDNLGILRELRVFRELDCPLLTGPSRKSFIGSLLDQPEPRERLYGTLGAVAAAVRNGAAIVRVHDVKPVREMLTVMLAVEGREN